MGLTKEKIANNAKTFFATLEKYGVSNDELINQIGEKLIDAPATMTSEGYNSFDGGLIQHIIHLTSHAIKINDDLNVLGKGVDRASLIKVAFLHQIGKADMFTKRDSEWHIERGMNYEFNNSTLPMTVSNHTVDILAEVKIFELLSKSERQAIMLIPTDIGNRKLNGDSERIVGIIKAATIMAIIQEK